MSDAILMALAPVFFVLALGYAAGRFRLVDNKHIDGFNVLVMNFALPASLFVATASAPKAQMLAQAPLFAIFGAVMLILWGLSYAFRRTVTKASRADAALQALTIAYPNLAGVGLPIVAAVLGPQGAVPVAVALAAGSILVTPLTLVLLEMDGKGGGNAQGAAAAVSAPRGTHVDGTGHAQPTAPAKASQLAAIPPAPSTARRVAMAFRHALTRPVVLAPALGIVISLCGVPLDSIVATSLMLIGHAAAGVALFLTGLILSSQSFRLDAKVVSATAMADVVRPLAAAALVFLLPTTAEMARTAILLAAVPSGFFGILFAVSYRKDSATPGSMVLASTVVSAITLAIAIAVLFPR